jgi:hypothetical protein
MRKVIANNIVSLDGYYADETGNPLVLTMDAAFDRANLESIQRADMILPGRDSFDGFSSYWPSVHRTGATEAHRRPPLRRLRQHRTALPTRTRTPLNACTPQLGERAKLPLDGRQQSLGPARPSRPAPHARRSRPDITVAATKA